MDWILICNRCTFGEKSCYNSRDEEFLLLFWRALISVDTAESNPFECMNSVTQSRLIHHDKPESVFRSTYNPIHHTLQWRKHCHLQCRSLFIIFELIVMTMTFCGNDVSLSVASYWYVFYPYVFKCFNYSRMSRCAYMPRWTKRLLTWGESVDT